MKEYLIPFVRLLNEMSPYLLLGFLIAGIMHAFVPRTLYSRYLAGNDFRSAASAALLGVPLPLCSCGVIPTAMSMRREGASKAATVSFLISTPQTGVDSIAATASLLGLPFAVLRPVAAFVTALFGGTLAGALSSGEESVGGVHTAADSDRPKSFAGKCRLALRYGFVDMMQDIGRWLVLGLLIAGLITIFLPDDFFARFGDYPLMNMAIVLLLSIPMYLCATGSVPVAAALMLKGLSPGAALVLLMAGPATNMAAILVIGKVLGRKTLIVYLLSIIVGAVAFGLAVDMLLPAEWFSAVSHGEFCSHCTTGSQWWKTVSSVLFVVLLVAAYVRKYYFKTDKSMNNERVYAIKGMMCNHCKANVERVIAAVAGVERVEVDLSDGTASVDGAAECDEIIAAVTGAGYECYAKE